MKINSFKILAIILLFVSASSNAQSWTELNPPPNIFNDAIFALATDSSGMIYAAGKFKNINNKYIVARWKNGTWAEIENGTDSLKGDNPIFGLAVDKAGKLYAAGAFTNSSGNYYVARWNDTTWSQVGTGTNALNPNGAMYAITTDHLNNVYVAGAFTNAAGKQYVAKWNGTSWSELGTGVNALNGNGIIYSITTDAAGNIYAAGHLKNASGKYYVAKWNGTTWSELGTGTNALSANDYINCVKTDNAGNVYAAGAFRNSSSEYYVAKYNGSTWIEVGSGANALHGNGTLHTLVVNNTGTIYAGGVSANSSGGVNVVKWNGASWSEIFTVGGSLNSTVRTITIDSIGNVYAGGDFRNGNNHSYVAKWNGTIMKELGRQGEYLPWANGIKLTKADKFGTVYAIGDFWTTSALTEVAKWDGVGWKRLQNTTLPFSVENVEAITTDSLGNVYVGGRFKNLNNEYYVARWNGANWIELTGANTSLHATGYITSLITDSSRNIYATGYFEENSIGYSIAKWDGTNWTKLASAPGSSYASPVPGPFKSVYVSGLSPGSGSIFTVFRVDSNGVLNELGTGANALNANSFIKSIAVDDNGNVYAAGMFFNSTGERYVAKWNGVTWSKLGTIPDASIFYGLAADTMGNVFASVSCSTADDYVAKWNGSSWSKLSGDNNYNFNSAILSLYKDQRENLYAAGYFNNDASRHFVAAYGKSILILKKPLLSSSPNQYCGSAGSQTIRILNLGDTSRVHALAKLDNTILPVNADSTLSFSISSLTAGNHRITVFFYIGADSMYTIKDFVILAAVSPDVNISASTTMVTNLNPVTITATNAAGGGTSPLFTFAKDRTITTILQAESGNNIMNLDPNTLSVGDNWIYVRMKTSSSCYTTQTNIDSIKIVRSAATGITDIDFPNQQIYIYPNPFQQSIMIRGLQISKSYSISLINSLGQLMFEKTVRNNTELIINANAPTGLYWLKIYDNSKNRLIGAAGLIKN